MSEPSELFLDHHSAILQIVAAICRRNGMDVEAAEEFSADVMYRLVKDEYAIIRAFRGRSSFDTYIAAVVRRLLLDYRNREWGKWRQSAEAQRLGGIAIEVERLIHRDRRSIDETFELVQRKYPAVTLAEVNAIASRLPARMRRTRVDIDEAAPIASASDPHGETVRAENAAAISVIVRRFIGDLPVEDQLVFRLKFQADMTVSEVARSMNLDIQALFRRLRKHLRDLRRALEVGGIAESDVEDLIGADSIPFDFQPKSGDTRPSEAGESAVAARQEEIS